jgi:hypothetical protein
MTPSIVMLSTAAMLLMVSLLGVVVAPYTNGTG